MARHCWAMALVIGLMGGEAGDEGLLAAHLEEQG
jgi:hypothetical protein